MIFSSKNYCEKVIPKKREKLTDEMNLIKYEF